MKLRTGHTSRRQQGSAVIAIMVILGLMLLYVGANLKTLHFMNRELKLIEKHQVRRLQAVPKPASQQPTGAAKKPADDQPPAGVGFGEQS